MKRSFIFILLLLLISSVLAQDSDEFEIFSKQSIDSCDCSQYIHEFTVKNTGSASEFRINPKGLNSKWISLSANSFILNHDEVQKITALINIPCSIRGSYDLSLEVLTPTSSQLLPLDLSVDRCPNIEVNLDNYKAECPGEQITQSIEIKNTGTFKETYTFDVKGASIDYKAVEIKPGSTAKFNIYVDVPLDVEDEFNLSFITKTKFSKLTATTPLSFTPSPCYKYTISHEGNYTSCSGLEESIPIIVENRGTKEQEVEFYVKQKWAGLIDKVLLQPGQVETLTIDIEPRRTGKYTIDITSKLNYEQKDKINLDVKSERDCYKAEFTSEFIPLNEQGSFTLKNVGVKEATYNLLIDADWIVIPESVTLAPEEEEEIDLDINWEGREGKHNLQIKAVKDDQTYTESITFGEIVFHKKIGQFFVNLYTNVKDLFINNFKITGIVVGAVILLIIIIKIIIKISEKKLEKELLKEPKEEKKKVKKEKPKKIKAEVKAEKVKSVKKVKTEPFSIPWNFIVPIFIIVAIALLAYFAKDYFLTYWIFGVVGIAFLFLLILFINLMSKVKIKKKDKIIKWVITLLIILLILLFIYLQVPSINLDPVGNFFVKIGSFLKSIFSPFYDFLYVYVNYIVVAFVILLIAIFFINMFEKKKGKKEKSLKKNNNKKSSKRKRK